MHACQPEVKHLAVRHPISVSVRAPRSLALMHVTLHEASRLVSQASHHDLMSRTYILQLPLADYFYVL